MLLPTWEGNKCKNLIKKSLILQQQTANLHEKYGTQMWRYPNSQVFLK